MAGNSTFVFALIAVAAVLMASNKVRFDIVALLVVLALMLSGELSTVQAAELGLLAYSGNDAELVQSVFEGGFQSTS